MRFYDQAHAFYCGVDLHARTMYLCILEQGGTIVLRSNTGVSQTQALTIKTRQIFD